MPLVIPTRRALLYKPPVAAASSYTGAGDIVSGAYAWYGLRGYNAAYATGSNPALDLVDQAGANPLTVNILSNGRLDVASIDSWVTANSVTTIKIAQAYDQTGNSRHVVQATLANMPVLNLTGLGSLPAMVFTQANSHNLLSSATVTQAQPLTVSIVYKYGSATSQLANNGPIHIFTLSNQFSMQSPTYQAVTVSTGVWHAVQAVFNGASSDAYVEGASNPVSPGTSSPSSSAISLGRGVVSAYLSGSIAETGFWPSGFDATQAGNMNTNQHGTDGHNF